MIYIYSLGRAARYYGERIALSISGKWLTFRELHDRVARIAAVVAMLPRKLALWAAAHAPLALLDPPYTSIGIEIEMLWVEGADQDEGLQWLLNELAESIGDLG